MHRRPGSGKIHSPLLFHITITVKLPKCGDSKICHKGLDHITSVVIISSSTNRFSLAARFFYPVIKKRKYYFINLETRSFYGFRIGSKNMEMKISIEKCNYL